METTHKEATKLVVRARQCAVAATMMLGVAALGMPSSSHAAALGYGDFLGQFAGNVNDAEDVENALATLRPGLDLGDVGNWDGTSHGQMTFTMTVFKAGTPPEPIGGDWAYLGFPPGTPPESDPIDLYLAVKYGNQFSVFEYFAVDPLDTGLFSTDLAFLTHNRNGQPFAISHILAYWSEIPVAVPVPPALVLLLTGLGALFGLGRRRMKNATPEFAAAQG